MEEVKVKYTADYSEYKKQMADATVETKKFDDAAAKANSDIDKGIQKSTDSVKSFKTQIKEATQAYLTLAQKYGETSKEATAAAAAVGKLKGEFTDFQERVKTFDPNKKFQALTDTVRVAASAFSGLTAAQALLGNNSEELQKTLLKVQAAMALSDSISSLLDAGDAFKNLKGVIMTSVIPALSTLKGALIATGIGAAAVLVGLLVANWEAVSKAVKGFLGIAPSLQDSVEEQTKAYEEQNKAIERNSRLQTSAISVLKGREKEQAELTNKGTEAILKLVQERDKKLLEIQDEKSKDFIEDEVKRNSEIFKINEDYAKLMANAAESNTNEQKLQADKWHKEDIAKKKTKDDEFFALEKKKFDHLEFLRKNAKQEKQNEIDFLDSIAKEEKEKAEATQAAKNEIASEGIQKSIQGYRFSVEEDRAANFKKLESAKGLGEGLINISNAVAAVAGENASGFTAFSKALALVNIGITTAIAYSNAAATSYNPLDPLNAIPGWTQAKMATFFGIIAANTASAVGIVSSMVAPAAPPKTSTPKFKDGAVNLEGPGTETSDSIYARLSRGESIITAKSTKAHEDELIALNKSTMDYENLIYLKYVKPAIIAEKKKTFAENVANSVAFNSNFDDTRIVDTLKKNKPATSEDINKLTRSIERSAREQSFLKKNLPSR